MRATAIVLMLSFFLAGCNGSEHTFSSSVNTDFPSKSSDNMCMVLYSDFASVVESSDLIVMAICETSATENDIQTSTFTITYVYKGRTIDEGQNTNLNVQQLDGQPESLPSGMVTDAPEDNPYRFIAGDTYVLCLDIAIGEGYCFLSTAGHSVYIVEPGGRINGARGTEFPFDKSLFE